MENLIDWITTMLSKDGINSKSLVKTALEEMTIDDWYKLRDCCNIKIVELRSKGLKPEDNPNVLLLMSYQSDVYQCELLEREIAVLSNFVQGPNYSGMPFAPPKSSNPVEKQHIKLIDSKHRLETLMELKAHKLEKCINLIDHVDDSRGRYILTAIFLNGKTQFQILDEAPFNISYRQLYRIKKSALDQIRKIEVL